MTWDLEDDPIRQFSNALTVTARRAVRLDYITIPVIRQACQKTSPRQLADVVSNGIARYPDDNRWPIIWHRIRRAAGLLDEHDHHEEAPE